MDATWIFMRHFQKKPHSKMYTVNKAREAARDPKLAQALVERWDEVDREDVCLHINGIADAHVVSMWLPEYLRRNRITVERIIASPYRRTYESAKLLQANCFTGMRIRVDERLVELKNGVRNLLFEDFETICELWPEYGRAAHTAFLSAAPPHGESHAEVRDGRVKSFLNDLKRLKGGTLIMTHAGIIECLHQIVYGTRDEDVVRKFSERRCADYGSMLVCSYDHRKNTIRPIIDNYCLHELS